MIGRDWFSVSLTCSRRDSSLCLDLWLCMTVFACVWMWVSVGEEWEHAMLVWVERVLVWATVLTCELALVR